MPQIQSPLIILDRDGVLNRMVIDPDHGTVDSPLNPDQVEVYSWVPEAIARLNRLGFGLAIATNQPSLAKRKTTRENLEAVHQKIVNAAQSQGGVILSSHICFHRSEDKCGCRKPKTGLLEQAFDANPRYLREGSWMVGDGITDVQAGAALGLKTAFLGPNKCDHCKIFEERDLKPLFWGNNLLEFTQFLESRI